MLVRWIENGFGAGRGRTGLGGKFLEEGNETSLPYPAKSPLPSVKPPPVSVRDHGAGAVDGERIWGGKFLEGGGK